MACVRGAPLFRACVLCLGLLLLTASCADGDGTCDAASCARPEDAAASAESRGSVLLQVKQPKVSSRAAGLEELQEVEEEEDEKEEEKEEAEEVEVDGQEEEEEQEEEEPTDVSSPEVKLKFMEWNVWYNNKDTSGMAATIKQNNPDVIGLNEFTASKTSLQSHLNAQIQGRAYEVQPGWSSFKGYGTYIFYDSNRFDGLEGGVETVHCSGTRGGDRAANWAVLREKTYQGVLITGGIHLSYCSSGCDSVHECELGKMYDNFYAMKSRYPSAQVVWMGDLNRGPSDRIVRNLLQGRLGSRQVFPVNDLSQAAHRTFMYGGTIDHIFGESGFRRVEGGNTGQGSPHQRLAGADHFPIYAKVLWSPSGDLGSPGAPQPTSPPPAPAPAGTCQPNQVQRRRRASSCSCRRRHGTSSTGMYTCVGNTLQMGR